MKEANQSEGTRTREEGSKTDNDSTAERMKHFFIDQSEQLMTISKKLQSLTSLRN